MLVFPKIIIIRYVKPAIIFFFWLIYYFTIRIAFVRVIPAGIFARRLVFIFSNEFIHSIGMDGFTSCIILIQHILCKWERITA